MDVRRVNCSQCGAELPTSFSTGEGRAPCPSCGATGITVSVEGGAVLTRSASASYSVHTENNAATRRRELESIFDDVEAAVAANIVSDAHAAVKRLLEAAHELNDCLKRGEWSQTSWSANELELWRAHIGVRNVAHHTSSPVVAIHSGPVRDARLRWDLDPSAVATLDSRAQANAYSARLAGMPVLPSLRALIALVRSSVT